MTYERWKQVNCKYRNPTFSFSTNPMGVTEEERKEYHADEQCHRQRYDQNCNRKVGCIVVGMIASPFIALVLLCLLCNFGRTAALENLTGKDLGYWDVFWAGSEIEAIATLQNKKR